MKYISFFVTIAALDLEAIVRFYTQLVDHPPQIHSPGSYAEFEISGLRLGIFQLKPDRSGEFAAPSSGALSLCLQVNDLDAAIARLTQLGYPPPGDILSTSHGREIYAYDPLGDRLILYEPQSKETRQATDS